MWKHYLWVWQLRVCLAPCNDCQQISCHEYVSLTAPGGKDNWATIFAFVLGHLYVYFAVCDVFSVSVSYDLPAPDEWSAPHSHPGVSVQW